MILSVTGHRPDKLGGYKTEIFSALTGFAITMLLELEPDKIITGMALGWDQAVACASIELDIPYIAAIPCYGQEKVWQKRYQDGYKFLKENANEIVITSKTPFFSACMQIRNEWMVDNSDKLLALWNGTHGGTYNCLSYAKQKNKEVINVWSYWMKFLRYGGTIGN
jgi:uncharacterized phage-like protein YoqJ